MVEKWEIGTGVSTPAERVFQMIEDSTRPVGIVVCGVDGEFKSEVVRETLYGLRGRIWYQRGVPSALSLMGALNVSESIGALVDVDEQVDRDEQQQLAETMRRVGAQKVLRFNVTHGAVAVTEIDTEGR